MLDKAILVWLFFAGNPSPVWIHPQFDPIALSLGPVAIHWYGLMYLLGFWPEQGWVFTVHHSP